MLDRAYHDTLDARADHEAEHDAEQDRQDTRGRPVSVNVETKNAPIVPISPWAKLSCPVDRKITTSARASIA